ncbi:MAG: ATP-binding protein [Actinobacteria bacterium]|nr:ATP-binding protein [Actinomycetota bacterium]
MDARKLSALYGLKWNPFLSDIPVEALHKSSRFDHFAWRIEDLVMHGGFALITGDPGAGKSVVMRLLAEHLSKLRDVVVGEVTRPQSRITDFYREVGDLFGLAVSTSNRWGAYKTVRAKWQDHIKQTLFRPVLLIDEAQEMSAPLLAELRLLGSTNLDSSTIVTVILCGDRRLEAKLRTPDLLPIDSRVRTRLVIEAETADTLGEMLRHILAAAGAPALMTDELQRTLCEHAAGNRRLLMNLCGDALALGVSKNAKRLDDGLYLEMTGADQRSHSPRSKPILVREKPSNRR